MTQNVQLIETFKKYVLNAFDLKDDELKKDALPAAQYIFIDHYTAYC